MEKVARITTFKDEGTDYAYWLTKSDVERLEALEMLRTQNINFRKDVPERLQRVARIITKKQS